MFTREFEDGKSADLPSSSVDQDLKKKTTRLRRQKTAVHKLASIIYIGCAHGMVGGILLGAVTLYNS